MNGYAKLPRSVLTALERAELTTNEFAVLVYLIGKFDYITSDHSATLRTLADSLRWERTDDYLRKILGSLQDKKWVKFESKQGQRNPYLFRPGSRLPGRDLGSTSDDTSDDTSDTTSDSDPPSQSEVTSDSPRSAEAAIPLPESVSGGSQPLISPRSQEGEEEGEEETAAVRTRWDRDEQDGGGDDDLDESSSIGSTDSKDEAEPRPLMLPSSSQDAKTQDAAADDDDGGAAATEHRASNGPAAASPPPSSFKNDEPNDEPNVGDEASGGSRDAQRSPERSDQVEVCDNCWRCGEKIVVDPSDPNDWLCLACRTKERSDGKAAPTTKPEPEGAAA